MSTQRNSSSVSEQTPVAKIPRGLAIDRMRTLAPKAARTELLQLIRDPVHDIRNRTLAAAALARTSEPDVVAELERLADADGPIALIAVRALGRRGSPKSLPVLQRAIAGKQSRAVRAAAAFAATLIAHRHGLPGHDPRSAPERARILAVIPAGLREMKFDDAMPDEMAHLRRNLAENAPGLELAARGWRINCRDRISVFALARELADEWRPEAFAKRKFHVGQVALRSESTGNYSPGLTVLTDPDGANGCVVAAYRSEGTLVMAGRGVPEGEYLQIQLGAVDRIASFPMDLCFIIGPDKLDVITAKVGSATRRNHPQPAPR